MAFLPMLLDLSTVLSSGARPVARLGHDFEGFSDERHRDGMLRRRLIDVEKIRDMREKMGS